MDEKLKKIIYVVLGVFVVIFLFLFIISSCDKEYKPEDFELYVVEKTKSYFSNNKSGLPGQNIILTLSLEDLVNKGIIKEPSKLLGKNGNCSGNIIVENNNDYYMYSPNLSCTYYNKTYNSNNLKETLLNNVVTNGYGLYQVGNEYYFKGDNVNNYLIFDGLLWRITKINSDNSIRLIEAGRREPVVWDDRYNNESGSTTGINNYVANNIPSRMKDYLDNIYKNDDVITNKSKGFIKETSICIGKRKSDETINDGSIECSQTLDNQYISLLQLNEYFMASLDKDCKSIESSSCSNYNYLANFDNSYWTITANADNTNQVYKINSTVSASSASNSGMARMVINISENTNVKGTGTEEDPYIVNGMSSEIRKIY